MNRNEYTEDFPTKESLKGSRNIKRLEDQKEKNHLKRIAENGAHYPYGAYPVDANGRFDDEDPVYYKRIYRGRRSNGIKKDCHKAFRRTDIVSRSKGILKRTTEFWYELI